MQNSDSLTNYEPSAFDSMVPVGTLSLLDKTIFPQVIEQRPSLAADLKVDEDNIKRARKVLAESQNEMFHDLKAFCELAMAHPQLEDHKPTKKYAEKLQ